MASKHPYLAVLLFLAKGTIEWTKKDRMRDKEEKNARETPHCTDVESSTVEQHQRRQPLVRMMMMNSSSSAGAGEDGLRLPAAQGLRSYSNHDDNESSPLLVEPTMDTTAAAAAKDSNDIKGIPTPWTSCCRLVGPSKIVAFTAVVLATAVVCCCSGGSSLLARILRSDCTVTSFLTLLDPRVEKQQPQQTLFTSLPSSSSSSSFQQQHGCHDGLCFTPNRIRVQEGRSAFPSFWDFHRRHHASEVLGTHYSDPILVSYDARSITLNGTRALFLGGSMHPTRATHQTWNMALDDAVHQGLNLITTYIFWSAHQPKRENRLDWTLQRNVPCNGVATTVADDSIHGQPEGQQTLCNWTVADSIRDAANRGLFVHVRIGPYDCAEYNYGGIPEWLPLTNENMSMRRPNVEWMAAMEGFVIDIVHHLKDSNLFADQGGPIILGQIENELGESSDQDVAREQGGSVAMVDGSGHFGTGKNDRSGPVVRNATLQDYAQWCGDLVNRLVPGVVWTMCNGLSASNTVETYNGAFDDTHWLDGHGSNKRIQVDQPALWTEDEGTGDFNMFLLRFEVSKHSP
jgi:Glycosyl hydrolases family 35